MDKKNHLQLSVAHTRGIIEAFMAMDPRFATAMNPVVDVIDELLDELQRLELKSESATMARDEALARMGNLKEENVADPILAAVSNLPGPIVLYPEDLKATWGDEVRVLRTAINARFNQKPSGLEPPRAGTKRRITILRCKMNLYRFDPTAIVDKLPPIAKAIMESFPGKVILAGGFCRDHFARLEPRDIDLFCGDEETYSKAAEMLVSKAGILDGNDDAKWTTNGTEFPVPIQLIRRRKFANTKELLEDFDFSCNQIAVRFDGKWIGEQAPYAEFKAVQRFLIYLHPKRDGSYLREFNRMLKLIKRGFFPEPYSLSRILMDIKEEIGQEDMVAKLTKPGWSSQ